MSLRRSRSASQRMTKHQVPMTKQMPMTEVSNTKQPGAKSMRLTFGHWNLGFVWTLVLVIWCFASSARADQHIGDFCRIKGQEENTLHGMGLVVGLKGTGDGDSKATHRALARYMELMGHRLASDVKGKTMLEELKSVKNVALVFVTTTVPPGGAQQGDLLDCRVSAVSAKSLDGGTLMLTQSHGPLPGDKTVYALASGLVSIDDETRPQSGRISLGCQMEQSLANEYVKDGKLILVINKDHAAF